MSKEGRVMDMHNKVNPGLAGCYEKTAIDEAIKNNRLLNCDIELTLGCNLRCKFCYEGAGKQASGNELTVTEIKRIIDEANNLGAKNITLLGGEPLLYPHFFEIAEYVTKASMDVLIFTNATLITTEIAKRLSDLNVGVCVALEALNPEIHDEMVGVNGAHQKTLEGINNLIVVGYTKDIPLSINATITNINYSDLENLCLWALEKKIEPFLFRLIPNPRAYISKDLQVSASQLKELSEKISPIKKYSRELPFFDNSGCVKHYISCYVTCEGFVQPCSNVNIYCGNVRSKSLTSIVNSPIIKMMRGIGSNIQGYCKECKYHDVCY
ncbi:MAG TPA: hypothetical protein C5S37_05135, partial [Methanophagales archaeon]|nr:hypothetical protein [Methanophagales archaeon]